MKKFFKSMGILGIAVGVIYWFDLDNKIIAKTVPVMKKIAAMKKMAEAQKLQAEANAKMEMAKEELAKEQ